MRRIRPYGPPLAAMLVITGLSSVPGTAEHTPRLLMALDPTWQNLLHVPLFSTLQVLWLRAFSRAGRSRPNGLLLGLSLTILFGVVDEMHQAFVPGRYASLVDIQLNAVGALFGVGLYSLIRRKDDARSGRGGQRENTLSRTQDPLPTEQG